MTSNEEEQLDLIRAELDAMCGAPEFVNEVLDAINHNAGDPHPHRDAAPPHNDNIILCDAGCGRPSWCYSRTLGDIWLCEECDTLLTTWNDQPLQVRVALIKAAWLQQC